MKASLLIVFSILYCLNGFAQPRSGFFMWPYGTGDKIEFLESVVIPSAASADSLFGVAKTFASGKYTTENDTVVINERRRTIICKSALPLPVKEMGEKGKGYIGYTLTIVCGYKTFRYSITDLEHFPEYANGPYGGPLEADHAACGGKCFPQRYWNQTKADAYYLIQSFIENLKESMQKPFVRH